jgi:hypothetical protein
MIRLHKLGLAALCIGTTAAAQTSTIPPAEKAAIVATALDYGDGFYSGAPERMERAIHPDLNKVVVQALPQTGRFVAGYSTYSGLIELSRAKVGYRAPEQRKIAAEVLAVNGDVALAKVTSAMFNDFLTLVKVDGAWKIVNVLWVPGPDAPNRPMLPAADEVAQRTSIASAVADFLLGLQSSDAALLEKVLHPEVNLAGFAAYPGAKPAITRTRYSGIVEPARAKMMPVVPEGARVRESKIVAVMDGMAVVEATLPNAYLVLQVQHLEGSWRILNILSKRIMPGR